MNKNIVCGGCSFTQKDLYDFKVWPEFLGKKLDLPVINLGKGGKGNGYIAQSLFNYIIKHHYEIDSVFVLWTDFWRHEMYNHAFTSTPWQSMLLDDGTVPNNIDDCLARGRKTKQMGSETFLLEELNEHQRSGHFDSPLLMLKSWEHTIKLRSAKNILETIYRNNFYHIKTVELLCESLNIPYTAWCALSGCAKGLHFSWMGNNKSIGESIQRSVPIIGNLYDEAENYLNIKNYIKWPWLFWQKNDVSSFIVEKDLKYAVSEIDNHPSELGHELITKVFFDYYVENYFNESPNFIYE